jgi:UDP-glucose 6-dehydrogenase
MVVDELQRQLKTLRGARICLLGLAFKPETDDLRDAPAIDIAHRLLGRGAFVSAHDPMVDSLPGVPAVRMFDDPYLAATGADAVVVATEWAQFLVLDIHRLAGTMRGDVFFDGRNVFDADVVRSAGFRYAGVGRPTLHRHAAETGAGSIVADRPSVMLR